MHNGGANIPKKKKTLYSSLGLTDLDESVLFLTRPYAMITLVCWVLSLYCIIYTRNDSQSSSFVLSVITFVINNIFLIILYFKAKRIRSKAKDDE